MKRFIAFNAVLLIAGFSVVAFSADGNTEAETEVKSPWSFSAYTETTFGWSEDFESNDWNQETAASVGYNLGDDYSVRVKQAFYNAWRKEGENAEGKFSIANTQIDFSKRSFAKIEPAGIGLNAGLRVMLPTSRLMEDNRDSAFITYIQPSISGSKAWGKLSLSSAVGFRFYITEHPYNFSGMKKDDDGNDTNEPDISPNPRAQQNWATTVAYKLSEKLNVSATSYFFMTWFRTQASRVSPKLLFIPDVSYSVTDNLGLSLGLYLGDDSIRKWANDPVDIIQSGSSAYANVSYSF
ncbi:hypothetical protein ACFLRA_04095 [Bdellovibrionota bacterium]